MRILHLHLISNSRSGISPIIGSRKSARRSSLRQGTRHLAWRNTHLSGHFAINSNINAGIVERLLVLQIAKLRNAVERLQNAICECSRYRKIRPEDGHFDRCWCAEVHNLADQIAGLERKGRTGKFRWQFMSKPFFEICDFDVPLGP